MRIPVLLLFLPAFACAGMDVTVKGNSFLKSRQIKEVLAPEPENYNKDGILTWQEDAQFYTLDLYRHSGFFDAKVDVDVVPREGGDKKDWNATLSIREGERYLFDSVRVVVVVDTSTPAPAPGATAADTVGTAEIGVDTAGMDTVKMAPPSQAPQTALVVDSSDLEAKRGRPYQEDLVFQDPVICCSDTATPDTCGPRWTTR